jgi:UV DNA damage endonuclease
MLPNNRIGYAAINSSFKPRTYKSIRLKTIESKGIEALITVIKSNLDLLLDILRWNIENDIYFYRFPSNIFPLANHPIIREKFIWEENEEIRIKISKINDFVNENEVRLTVHPDQFIVLNSLNSEVVHSSIETLEDTCLLLELLGGSDCILHIGGVYGNKQEAITRFIENFQLLSHRVQKYLRIENDDKSYTYDDVLMIANQIKIPMILDIHHHRCLSSSNLTTDMVIDVFKTWGNQRPKIHMSSGREFDEDRKHADFITFKDITYVKGLLQDEEVDIMIEAKAKELAALEFIKKWRDSYV